MKTLSPELQNHLAQEVTTIATCWKIVRTDGVTQGFTDHDKDLEVDGVVYSSSSGYERTAISNNSSLAVDNLDVVGVLDSDHLKEEDLRNGVYDYASVFVFLVNWQDLSQGILKMRRGWFGQISLGKRGAFETELRGLTQALSFNIIELYSPECRADFGDSRCKRDLVSLQQTTAVATAASRESFSVTGVVTPVNGLVGGTVRFLSGQNSGRTLEITGWDELTQTLTLFLPAYYPIEIGDQVVITPGCDKRPETCKSYGNFVNYRGEPHVPGQDELMQYPDAK